MTKIYLSCLHCLKETELPADDFDQAAAIDVFSIVHGAHAKPEEIAVSVHEPWWTGVVKQCARVKH